MHYDSMICVISKSSGIVWVRKKHLRLWQKINNSYSWRVFAKIKRIRFFPAIPMNSRKAVSGRKPYDRFTGLATGMGIG